MASGAKVSRKTRNDLPEKVRAKVCGVLQARLLETIDLHWQVKQAHWTVRGENFIALHELFDKVAEHVNEFADEIAERIQMLGGHAVGTIQAAVKGSTLPPYPVAITASRDHVRAVAAALGAYGKLVRKAIDETDDAGDKDTADLFTGISREVDKQLWFVESHEG